MGERERETGKFVEDKRERAGKYPKFKLLQISNYEREFHKIQVNR